MTSEHRMELEVDVLILARAAGDSIYSRPHLLALLNDETLERVRLHLLDLYIDGVGTLP